MAATIIDGSEHHFVNIWEGTGKGQRVGNFIPFEDDGTITNSVIYHQDDDPMLAYTPSGTGTNRRKYTLSCWVKPALASTAGNERYIMDAGPYGNSDGLFFSSTRNLKFWMNGTIAASLISNRTFENISKWYHILVAVDTTQSTASDRIKIYVDGSQITSFSTENYPSQDYDGNWSTNVQHTVGSSTGNNRQMDGYLAEVNYVDGTAYAPSTFGVTDTTTGRWIPKNLSGISYGTNGFRLEFKQSGVGSGSASTIGADTSGQNNHLTSTNLAAIDQSTNTPTNNIAVMQNYTTSYKQTIAQGNRQTTTTGSNAGYPVMSTLKMSKGKYYAEVRPSSSGGGNTLAIGVYYYDELANFSSGNFYIGHSGSNGTGAGIWYAGSGTVRRGTGSSHVSESVTLSLSAGDVLGIAVDCDNDKISFYNNSGSLFATTTLMKKPVVFAAMTNASGVSYIWNFGDNGTFLGNETAGGNTDANSEGNFYHSVPANHVMLKQDNLEAAENVTKGIPDFMQIKNRDATDRWCWQDTLRGLGEYGSSASGAPGSPVQFNSAITDGVVKTLKGGFEVEDSDYVNSQSESYVSMNWVANNGVSATDSSGNMPCELQANPTAGFSIAKFTVNGTGIRTWAHGLGKTPEFGHLWVYNNTPYGTTYHHKMSATPAQHYTLMVSSQAVTSFTNGWGTAGPSSSLWSGNEGQLFSNGVPYIFYSWTGIEGYSKFDTYSGNGSTDGTFVYTGFKPRTIWIKGTHTISQYVFDTVRNPNNPNGKRLVYDGTYVEDAGSTEALLIMSNGFKLTNTSSGTNGNGSKYIYGAWAEHPFFGADGKSIATAYG